ncbi:uncharacterized protein LAJ45_10166 [Morchella importuna]|uniref:uncharacterized protein n=1 Tax=Morchella importuna TaxID=1174673 RepID=UPI001E8DBCFF|nr:uncharacterized protein LAJ45_10166 [Morchella importuna]KAH8145841.1 hypothetical protein LAJ45_10166 [Morchella importuna]
MSLPVTTPPGDMFTPALDVAAATTEEISPLTRASSDTAPHLPMRRLIRAEKRIRAAEKGIKAAGKRAKAAEKRIKAALKPAATSPPDHTILTSVGARTIVFRLHGIDYELPNTTGAGLAETLRVARVHWAEARDADQLRLTGEQVAWLHGEIVVIHGGRIRTGTG